MSTKGIRKVIGGFKGVPRLKRTKSSNPLAYRKPAGVSLLEILQRKGRST